ncbi:MAG: HAD family hydrolase [Pseudomonadota bacterium]|nr:HAD family hydrolase [Pseudomonadota bacterium]
MALALFDLDNTLLAGDSDHLWGDFLSEQGAVDPAWYRAENERFYRAYQEGTLDIYEFLAFSLRPLSEHPLSLLERWRTAFFQSKIEPIMLPAARELLARHRRAGDTLLIITATNRFVTDPIAQAFAVDALLATEPELLNGRYTGKVCGVPCFQSGKVTRLDAWMNERDQTWAGSYFYSDSHNDLPLLERVAHPVAVDPDPQLAAAARARDWPVISLREPDSSP